VVVMGAIYDALEGGRRLMEGRKDGRM